MLAREDLSNLSGRVGHGDSFPPKNISRYGPVPLQVKLLDGVMLCVKGKTLLEHALRFDEQFDFHFYDLDFCRQVEQLGLKCGTVDVSLVHKSGGNFGSGAWMMGYQKYLAKWGD
jgi:GT2 family glycosyltransferase